MLNESKRHSDLDALDHDTHLSTSIILVDFTFLYKLKINMTLEIRKGGRKGHLDPDRGLQNR